MSLVWAVCAHTAWVGYRSGPGVRHSSAPAGYRVSTEIMPSVPARWEIWVPLLGQQDPLEKR